MSQFFKACPLKINVKAKLKSYLNKNNLKLQSIKKIRCKLNQILYFKPKFENINFAHNIQCYNRDHDYADKCQDIANDEQNRPQVRKDSTIHWLEDGVNLPFEASTLLSSSFSSSLSGSSSSREHGKGEDVLEVEGEVGWEWGFGTFPTPT